jgi:hypothetical protein
MFALLAALMLLFPGPSTLPRTHTLNGTVTVGAQFVAVNGPTCEGTDDVASIWPGAYVTVRDEFFNVLATEVIGTGRLGPATGACKFTFQIDQLPPRTLYRITIADWDFGYYTHARLDEQHWRIAFGIAV